VKKTSAGEKMGVILKLLYCVVWRSKFNKIGFYGKMSSFTGNGSFNYELRASFPIVSGSTIGGKWWGNQYLLQILNAVK
jgi:hypothetical protein